MSDISKPGETVAIQRARATAGRLSGALLIDGSLVAPVKNRNFVIHNPATGEQVGWAADAGVEDVDKAVAVATRAQAEWAKVPARERGKLMISAANRIAHHAEELAALVALESGKAMRTECRIEAVNFADVFEFFGGLASEIKGDTVPLRPGVFAYTVREPVGVVAAVLPWNMPLMLMAVKIAPALVAGNSVVVKSAEETPLAVLRAVELLNEVLPKGVLNILSGDGPGCGAPLVAHPGVTKVTFTGSVQTGKHIYMAAAAKLVPVTLELGGKSPMIVLADADLDRAIEGAVTGMRFTRQGQSCTAASRILVHESLHDSFVSGLKARVDALKIGDPLREETDIGAIISREQFDKVLGYIELGRSLPGAVAHECSELPADTRLQPGYFVRPVIFTGLDNRSRLAQEEIFGPVTCVIRFSTLDEALAIANDSDFGLAASVWTRDLPSAMRAIDRLQAGFIQVNQGQVAGMNISYGGFKQSGLGKELTLDSMLEHFTRSKSVVINFE